MFREKFRKLHGASNQRGSSEFGAFGVIDEESDRRRSRIEWNSMHVLIH